MTTSTSPPPASEHPLPVMKVTRYDRVSSFLLALILFVIGGVLWVMTNVISNWPVSEVPLVPMELVEVSGGFEDGNPEDSLQVESPEEEIPNASLESEETEEVNLEQSLDTVVAMSDQASQQVEQVLASDAASSGIPGSATGTGGRPLGFGPGRGGIPREQRWFIRFGEGATLDEYARQLEFFGIEMGALLPDGTLVYISRLSQNPPNKRTVQTGKGEERLYMTWQGGERRDADAQLFQRAGINVGKSPIFHFYPPPTEQLLAGLEQKHANRNPKEIRRTYFSVVTQGKGYAFRVTRQTYIK